jgi:NADH:ubiquinone oxidoreductase subunit 6 (subunit J)
MNCKEFLYSLCALIIFLLLLAGIFMLPPQEWYVKPLLILAWYIGAGYAARLAITLGDDDHTILSEGCLTIGFPLAGIFGLIFLTCFACSIWSGSDIGSESKKWEKDD